MCVSVDIRRVGFYQSMNLLELIWGRLGGNNIRSPCTGIPLEARLKSYNNYHHRRFWRVTSKKYHMIILSCLWIHIQFNCYFKVSITNNTRGFSTESLICSTTRNMQGFSTESLIIDQKYSINLGTVFRQFLFFFLILLEWI